MKQIIRLLVLLALIAPIGASAQTRKAKRKTRTPDNVEQAGDREPAKSVHDQFTGQGYGVAGCGLGSVVFGPKPGMVQVIAATTNGLFGSQTFGITTGTLNCDIPVQGQQAAAFIEVNREILSKEAARGQGETVSGLAYILECSDSAAFGDLLKSNYEAIFNPEKSSYDATREILSTMKNDKAVKAVCATLS